MKTKLDIEEMIKHIDREVKKYGELFPEDPKKIFSVLHNKDAIELCKVCGLSTMKNTLLWFLKKN